MFCYFIWICSSFVLFSITQGRECGVSHVQDCYNTLENFKLNFPFYGRDFDELEETCRSMNDSIECHEVYRDLCRGRTECGEDCQKMIADLDMYSEDLGPIILQQQLCDNQSSVKQAYLNTNSCWEGSKINMYAACLNDSVLSTKFISTIQDPAQRKTADCCFFTWYHDCFLNITRENCDEQATELMSSLLNAFLSHSIHKLCLTSSANCIKPPLSTDNSNEEGIIVLKDIDITETYIAPAIDDSDLLHIINVTIKHHNVNDSEKNVIVDSASKDKSTGATLTNSLITVTLTFMWITLLRYIL